jgi:hypothetical protein
MKYYRIVWKGKITECGGQGNWWSEDKVSETVMLKKVIDLNKKYAQLDHKLETKEGENQNETERI